LGNELPEKVVQEMGELDLIIRFGFGIVVGDALNAPKHGILSFHHGDLREYRGGPFGFWEFFHNKNTAGITLQRINDSLDGGEIIVLSEIDISSASSWTDVRVQLLSHSTDMLAEGVPKAVNSDFSASTPKKLGDLYTSPGNIDMLKLLVRRILR
jgi:methionyl-tRNA formyltransferase